MSGPSGQNTKAQKIDRILSRQAEANLQLSNIFALMRLNHETDQATIKMLTYTAHSLETENARLRKYLGSVLFKRRRLESASDVEFRLEPAWGGRQQPESKIYHGDLRLDLAQQLSDTAARFRR